MADQEDNILIGIEGQDNASDAFEDVAKASEELEEAIAEANERMKEGNKFTDLWEEALSTATDTADAATKTIALLTADIMGGVRAFEESSQKIVDAHKKLAEYGATAEQQTQALLLINRAITEHGISAAKAGFAMEELAIEFTDAATAMAHYDKAVKFATNSTQKFEVAMGDYVDATRGGTAGIRRFGAANTALADAIDKIRDPALRAKVATEELEKAQKRAAAGADTLTKAMDKVAMLQVELAKSGPLVANGVMLLAGAWAAAGAAAVAFATKSAKVALESNWETIQATSELEAAYKKVELALGNALIGPPEQAAAQIDGLTRAMLELEKSINDNSEEISDFVERAIDKFELLFDTLATTTSIALLPMALIADAISGILSLLQVLSGVIMEDLGPALASMGLISEETGEAIKKFGTETVTAGENTNYLTDDLFNAWDAFTDFTTAVNDGAEGAQRASEKINVLDSELIELKGTLSDLAASNALEFLEGFSGASVGPMADSFGAPKEKKKDKKRVRISGKGKASKAASAEAEALALANKAIEQEAEIFQRSLEDISVLQEKLNARRAESLDQAASDMAKAVAAAEAFITEFEAQSAKTLQAAEDQRRLAEETEYATQSLGAQKEAMEDLVGAAVDLSASLADGSLSMKDLASAALDTIGDISIKIGKSLFLMGLGLEGLKSLNPYAMIAFGGLAIAAGITMKKQAARIAPGSGPKATPKSAGETTLEKIGLKLIEQADRDRSDEKAINVFVGGRQLSKLATQAVTDSAARGNMIPTPLLSPQTSAGGF